MIHNKDLDAAFVMNFLEQMGKRPPDNELLEKGKVAYDLIKGTILEKNYQ